MNRKKERRQPQQQEQKKMEVENDNDREESKLRVSFLLAKEYHHYQPSIQIPSDPIAIPSTTRKTGLSAIVNHLLQRKIHVPKQDDEDDPEKEEDEEEDEKGKLPYLPFDFLLNQKLLQTQIEIAARREGLSLEHPIEIQYFPSLHLPQEDKDQTKQFPDWIYTLSFLSSSSSFASSMPSSHTMDTSSSQGHGWLIAGTGDGQIHRMDVCNSQSTWQKSHESQTHSEQLEQLTIQDSIQAHTGPVSCVALMGETNKDKDSNRIYIASGSMDQTLVTHTYSTHADNKNTRIQLHAVYKGGHFASISSVALLAPMFHNETSSATPHERVEGTISGWMASGDWDGGLCVWKVPSKNKDMNHNDDGDNEQASGENDEMGDIPSNLHVRKKAKQGPSRAEGESKSKHRKNSITNHYEDIVQEISPTFSFKAHSNNISGIAWGYQDTTSSSSNIPHMLLTSSWDHSIKSWDIETQSVIVTLNGSKVVTCMGRCYQSNVVATGHPDCTIRLWDMRSSHSDIGRATGSVSDSTLLPSHKAWISAVQWSPTNPYVLASSSHDGTVKLWDIRSSLPLHTIRAHSKDSKSLCLAYTNDRIFSGGSDCIVKVFKTN